MSDLYQFKTHKTKKYTTIDLTNVEDSRLSWKAKGIHLYLLSRPAEWKIWTNDLLKRSKDQQSSLLNGMKELCSLGYVYKAVSRENGHISNWIYLVFEKPTSIENAETELPKGFKLFFRKKEKDLLLNSLKTGNQVIENQVYNNNNSLEVSKDTISNKLPQIDIKYNHLFSYWNNISTMRTHKEGTKRHKKINELFRQLKMGTFYRQNALDKEYLKIHKIPTDYKNKKWTDEEIKITIDHLANSLLDGYTPEVDKSSWPRDLDTLIFNPRTGKSMFLKVSICPPKRIADEIKATPKNKSCYELYKKFFVNLEKLKSKKQENELILKFNDLWEELHTIYDSVSKYYNHTSFSSYLGSKKRPERFFKNHIKWLSKRNRININMMGVDTYTWQNFTNELIKDHGYILYPDSKQLKVLKREMKDADRRMGK
jgi:hypothetical protein